MENLFRSSSFIALQVKNRKEALKFYTETLGVEQAAELDADCGGIVLKHGSVSLVIAEVESTSPGTGAVFFEFITPELDSAVAKVLAAGCSLGQATSGKDFRGQMVVDPYGMKFHLYQSVKNA